MQYPRTIQPPDLAPILQSVKRTGRLIIAFKDVKSGGIGSEIAARVVEEAFDSVDAPILRISSSGVPMPFSPPFEHAHLPTAQRIMETAKRVIG
jgi:pyruvate dehydrogenase E1 component beta subunit